MSLRIALNSAYCFSRKMQPYCIAIVHGGWSTWAPWEGCSESCGTGLQTRHRTCTNPSPSYYGQYCLGDPVEYSLCHGNSCGNQSTDSKYTHVYMLEDNTTTSNESSNIAVSYLFVWLLYSLCPCYVYTAC